MIIFWLHMEHLFMKKTRKGGQWNKNDDDDKEKRAADNAPDYQLLWGLFTFLPPIKILKQEEKSRAGAK